MRETFLNKEQRNEIHRAIEDAGGNPSEYILTGTRIEHPPSGGFLELSLWTVAMMGNPSMWEFLAWPCTGKNGTVAQTERRAMAYWPAVLGEVIPSWVQATRLESGPDLWALAEVAPHDDALDTDDALLTDDERERLAEALAAFRAEVSERLGLQAEEIDRLRQVVDRIEVASKKIGKSSVRDMVVGGVVRWTVGQGLDATAKPILAAAAKELWGAIAGSLGLPG